MIDCNLFFDLHYRICNFDWIEQFINFQSSIFLHGWEHMRINIQCHANICMPKTFLDYFRMDTLLQQKRCRRVSKIVEPIGGSPVSRSNS